MHKSDARFGVPSGGRKIFIDNCRIIFVTAGYQYTQIVQLHAVLTDAFINRADNEDIKVLEANHGDAVFLKLWNLICPMRAGWRLCHNALMNIEQIQAAAEADSPCLSDSSCIKIHVASWSSDSNADRLLDIFQDTVRKMGLLAQVVRTGSLGCYDLEPIVVADVPDFSAVLHRNVTPDSVPLLIEDCLKKNVHKQTGALCWAGSKKASGIPYIGELPLFRFQTRIALRNCGWVDPENINHYVVHGQGYTGLSGILRLERRTLLDSLVRPALRGRNEAAGSTEKRWRLCCESEESNKYLICNAIDMDPQALTARLLMDSDPHSVLEGILIGAYAAGASRSFILVKENTDSARRIKKALDQMRTYNLVGANILGSDFSLEIEVREVPAAAVSGYETELFRCIEENQPRPHVQPIHPLADEIMQRPVVITCPEILSNLSAGGTSNDKGSKIVTLAGCVIHPYTVEVPFETTIDALVAELGGGAAGGITIKAAKLGGPAGVFITHDLFDRSVEQALGEEGPDPNFCLGSIEVFDSDTCMVNAAKNVMSCVQAQSCGKCLFCREGSLQMLTLLEDIANDRASLRDLELLTDLGKNMREACLCAFGRTVPDPVLSSIRFFRSEYEERIKSSPHRVSTLNR